MATNKLKKTMDSELCKLSTKGDHGLAGQLITVLDEEGEEEIEAVIEVIDAKMHNMFLYDMEGQKMISRRTWEAIQFRNLSTLSVFRMLYCCWTG